MSVKIKVRDKVGKVVRDSGIDAGDAELFAKAMIDVERIKLWSFYDSALVIGFGLATFQVLVGYPPSLVQLFVIVVMVFALNLVRRVLAWRRVATLQRKMMDDFVKRRLN